MVRKIVVLILFLMGGTAQAQPQEQVTAPPMQKPASTLAPLGPPLDLSWGMTKEEVLQKHPQAISPDGEGLGFETQMLGNSANIILIFDQNQLTHVGVMFNSVSDAEGSEAVSLSREIYRALVVKYGPHTSSKVEGTQPRKKDDDLALAALIRIGMVRFSQTWVSQDTIIVSRIEGRKFKFAVSVLYLWKPALNKARSGPSGL
jgi:hypothetical protein